MKRNLLDSVWDSYRECSSGKKAYRKILKGIKQGDRPTIVLFPHDRSDLNYYGLLYIDEYLVRTLSRNALIVTSSEGVYRSAELFTDKIYGKILLEEKEMLSFLMLYPLLEPGYDVVVVSLERPEGRNAHRLLGAKGLTMEQIVAIGVFFIIPFRRVWTRPSYDGRDPCVLNLLKEGW